MSIGTNDSYNNNEISYVPLIATHGFSPSRAPEPLQFEIVGGGEGEGGFPILPVLLITGTATALVFALANQMFSQTKRRGNISADNAMDYTPFARLLEEFSDLSIESDHEWEKIEEHVANLESLTIKLFDKRTDRYVSATYVGLYGLGFEARGSFFQSPVPKTSWCWDQIDEIRFEQWVGGYKYFITTNLFKYHIESPDNVSLFESFYAICAWYSSVARFLTGQSLPRLNRPIDRNLIASLGLPLSCFVDGYPDFSSVNPTSLRSAVSEIANSKKKACLEGNYSDWFADWSAFADSLSTDQKIFADGPAASEIPSNKFTDFDLERYIEHVKSSDFPEASISESYIKGNYLIVKDVDGKILREIRTDDV